jgi:peptidyl-prolyl cis-trans isomerase D
MITAFRRYLDTWVVRAFFIIMVLSFVMWGVGDVIRLVGTSTWVAKVGDRTIEAQTLQAEYQRAVATVTRNLPQGQEATPDLRRRVADDTLQRLINQAALSSELRDLRIVTPDAAVAETARSMPAFRGPDGKFSRPQFDAVLRNNGLTEPRFMDMLRGDLAQRQLLGAVTAGAAAPRTELAPIYASEFERRSADMVVFPINAAPAPPAPDEAALQRWYDNHPTLYATPEFRRIKAIELTPEALAKEIAVTDDELRASFEQHRAEFVTVGKRSSQVISAPDEAKAKALAEQWRGGADWTAMQQAAQAAGASAVAFDDATEAQFPDPELGQAVFAAPVGSVADPVKGALAWFVVKVTKGSVGKETTFEQARDAVRDRVVADKAADLMYDRANKIDNLLANGTSLDDLPGDLGLLAVTGTLDSDGNTPEGGKAPIPGPEELRSAIVTAAFQTQKGDPPRLVEARTSSSAGSAYYALTVEDIAPAGEKPFETVKQRVVEDWTQDQQRHTQEQAAAAMLASVKGGQSFSDAATVAGVTPHISPVVTRAQPAEGMPPELQRVLFSLKKGEPTMVETAEGFIVGVPAEIIEPDPQADAAGFEQARTAVNRSIGSDLSSVFTEALRQRANPRINQSNFDQIVQP